MDDKDILSLDFDGVIHDGTYEPGTPMGPTVPGALEFMAEATKYFDVNVYSARSASAQGRVQMALYIRRNAEKSPNPKVRNVSGWLSLVKFPEHKPPAKVGYDDRILTFKGIFEDPKALMDFKSWRE